MAQCFGQIYIYCFGRLWCRSLPPGWGNNHFPPSPMALYSFILLMCALPYSILANLLIKHHDKNSLIAKATGSGLKGKLSVVCYVLAIPSAFLSVWISGTLLVLVAMVWLIPDKRIENVIKEAEKS